MTGFKKSCSSFISKSLYIHFDPSQAFFLSRCLIVLVIVTYEGFNCLQMFQIRKWRVYSL